MRRSARIPAFLGLAVLLAAAAFAAGKKPATEASKTNLYMESVNVTVVNVDVYVTDKKTHQPVTGLTRDDFEVLENGKPVKVTNFFVVEGGKSTLNGEAIEAPLSPAEAAIPKSVRDLERRTAPIPEDQRLRLVVYIDNFNIRPFNRNRVMRDLRLFLNQNVKRGDEVMLLTYDRSLKVRRPFTSDPNLISSSMAELERVSAQGTQQDSERRDVLHNIEDAQTLNEALSYARSYAESINNDLTFTVKSLRETVDWLAGMPGRKAVLYVSDGLPMVAGQDAFQAATDRFPNQQGSGGFIDSFQYDQSRQFGDLAAAANANRVTFYTIDAGGLRVSASVSAENAGGAGQSAFLDSMNVANLQSPLQYLAEKTGGVAIINTNNVLNLLNRVARDFDTFYSLGYSPANYGDGRFYRVDVKVKRKGLEVRHREGYRNKSPETLMSEGTLASLQFGYENNPMGIAVDFGTATQRKDGYYLVPVNVHIPLEKVVLVPREGGAEEARVRVFVGAMDKDGGLSEVQQTPVPISVPEADVAKIAGKHFTYTITLLMREGAQKVSVGVRDDVAGQGSFLSRGVLVGS